MRYRLKGSGDWGLAFAPARGSAGDMPVRFGKYFDPGSITSPSTYFKGFGQTADDTGTTDSSATTTPGWLQNLATGVTQALVGQQQISAISQLNQINIQRAAAGLPPISTSVLAQPGVQVGLSPDVQNLLLYGGLGVAALWIFSTVFKRS